MKKLYGLILIELMISISISLILVILLTEIYLSCQKSSQLESALTTMQMNATSFTSLLTSEIHKAGNIGCGKLTKDFPIISYGEYELNTTNKITLNTANQLTIRYADYPNAYIIEPTRENIIRINTDIKFHPYDVIFISNCKHAEIATIANVNINRGIQEIALTSPLHNQYQKYDEVSHFAINKFYTSKSHYGKSNSLFLENIKHEKFELIMGIDQMKITSSDKGIRIDFEISSPPLKKSWHLFAGLL